MPRAQKASANRNAKASGGSMRPIVEQNSGHDIDADRKPLFQGFVLSLLDAFLIIEGCRRGLIGRFVTKPSGLEKQALVQSGTVVVWEEEEVQMQRWTDSQLWSESRQVGPFLFYREAEEDDPLLKYGSDKMIPIPREARPYAGQLAERRKCRFRARVRDKWVAEKGLVKKTITIPYGPNRTWHISSYYYIEDILSGHLVQPSLDPTLCKLIPCISECLLDPKLYRKMVLNVAVNPETGKLMYESEWISGQEPEWPQRQAIDPQTPPSPNVGQSPGVKIDSALYSTSSMLGSITSPSNAASETTPYSPSSSPPSVNRPPQPQQRPSLESRVSQPALPPYKPNVLFIPSPFNDHDSYPTPVTSTSWTSQRSPWTPTLEYTPPSAILSPPVQNIVAPVPSSRPSPLARYDFDRVSTASTSPNALYQSTLVHHSDAFLRSSSSFPSYSFQQQPHRNDSHGSYTLHPSYDYRPRHVSLGHSGGAEYQFLAGQSPLPSASTSYYDRHPSYTLWSSCSSSSFDPEDASTVSEVSSETPLLSHDGFVTPVQIQEALNMEPRDCAPASAKSWRSDGQQWQETLDCGSSLSIDDRSWRPDLMIPYAYQKYATCTYNLT
ncbi:hypothetical protein FRB96_002019 [Tulasnella sp. 330]|nr:hypothetical protein FRB96_002019 [Tulasnella sp. 330]